MTVTGYGLAGTDAGNYMLVPPTGLTANITARPLGVAGLTVANRVYNAGTGSTLTGTPVGSEKVQASQSTDARDLLSRKAAVVWSSGGNEPVADEGRDGHSIFAWHFMRALEDVDTWQVGGNVFERVRAAVNKEFPQTPQYGASRPAGHEGNTDFLYERREIEAAAPAPAAPRR